MKNNEPPLRRTAPVPLDRAVEAGKPGPARGLDIPGPMSSMRTSGGGGEPRVRGEVRR
jgi:hypothetical protein